MIDSLPEDVLLDCIARVPKHKYSTLSVVCKLFRSIVNSPELYTRRSLLRCTETCIYVPIVNYRTSVVYWSTLDRINRILVPVPLLHPMRFRGSSYVVVGSRIFVFGEYNNYFFKNADVSTIDCRYDIVQPLGNMPKKFDKTTFSSIGDGKLYVVGINYMERYNLSCLSTMVLDMEAQTWKYRGMTMVAAPRSHLNSVAMDDKIYIKCCGNTFVSQPKEAKCEVEQILNFCWSGGNGCVMDGILYSYDITFNCLRAYDLKKRVPVASGVVRGVEGLIKDCYKVSVTSCGKKLILLTLEGNIFNEGRQVIWCAEIAFLGKNQRGEILGKVEWFQPVLDGDVELVDCLSVIV